MNEQQNIALIRKLYDAFARGDIQAILDELTPSVEWTLEGPPIIPFAGHRVGPAQVLGFFEGLGGTQHDMKLTTECFVAQGDIVASLGRYSGVVNATGKKFDTAVAHFFTIQNGKVSKFVDVGDTAAFVEAYTGASATAA